MYLSRVLSISIFTALFTVACQHEQPLTPPADRPNILVAIADDWSWPHARIYGDSVVTTPTFDRLAREGALFSHAYVSSPSCTPSRAAILTGQWHWKLEESANLWSTLQSKFGVYPDLLEAAGYYVGYTGKGWGPGKLEPGQRTRNPAGPQFENFVEFMEKRIDDRPFCFWLGSRDPHRPYEEGAGTNGGIELSEIELFPGFPESEEIRSDVADYYWEVQRFDREVGELIAFLEELGELDNTLVVMTSDNGMPFPRCKGNLYDTGTRVPLAMRWPAAIRPARVMDDFVSLTDLAPTFLEVGGVSAPEAMTGHSLVPLLESEASGRVDPSRTFVLTGKERHCPVQEAPDGGGTPMRAIRTYDYLYIRNFLPDRWPAGTPNFERAFFPGSWYGDVDNGPTKTHMVENRHQGELHQRLFDLAFAKRPPEELYDLRTDPDQLQNVAENGAYVEIRELLSQRMLEKLRDSADPRVLSTNPPFEDYPYYGGSPLKPGFTPSLD